MKAMVVSQFGGMGQLRLADAACPVPDRVKVQVAVQGGQCQDGSRPAHQRPYASNCRTYAGRCSGEGLAAVCKTKTQQAGRTGRPACFGLPNDLVRDRRSRA